MKLININGANATGKSTRVTTLIKYLEENFKAELIYKNCKNGYKEIGRIYKDYFIMGRFNKKGVWVGLDLADYSTLQSRLDLYKEISSEYPEVKYFVQEGYFNNASKNTTSDILKEYGVNSYHYYYIIYSDIEDYIDRCNGRTGLNRDLDWAKNSAGWKNNQNLYSIMDVYDKLNEPNGNTTKVDINAPKDYFVREFFDRTFEVPEIQPESDDW